MQKILASLLRLGTVQCACALCEEFPFPCQRETVRWLWLGEREPENTGKRSRDACLRGGSKRKQLDVADERRGKQRHDDDRSRSIVCRAVQAKANTPHPKSWLLRVARTDPRLRSRRCLLACYAQQHMYLVALDFFTLRQIPKQT